MPPPTGTGLQLFPSSSMRSLGKFSSLGSEASLAEAEVGGDGGEGVGGRGWVGWVRVPLELAPLLPGSYKPVIIFSKMYWLGLGKTTKINQNI